MRSSVRLWWVTDHPMRRCEEVSRTAVQCSFFSLVGCSVISARYSRLGQARVKWCLTRSSSVAGPVRPRWSRRRHKALDAGLAHQSTRPAGG